MLLLIGLFTFTAVYLLVYYGWATVCVFIHKQRQWYQRVLVTQLLIDVHPTTALLLAGVSVITGGLLGYLFIGHYVWMMIGSLVGGAMPYLWIKHLEAKRMEHLNYQLPDGITTLSSGVRAGLNLVQSMQMLADNSQPPIQQEIAQLLREYQMGLDLNHAMANASDRIGSSHYRLLFTALEMHRKRGGDVGESLDRIAESVREIQRLEGKLDALTASGRFQAMSIAAMPGVLVGVLYLVDPADVSLMFVHPYGRVIMVVIVLLIVTTFVWIRKIMDIDM